MYIEIDIYICIQFLGQEDPLGKGMATPVFLPGEFHRQRSLVDSFETPWTVAQGAPWVTPAVKNGSANTGDMSLISGSERSPGGGHDNSMDRGV